MDKKLSLISFQIKNQLEASLNTTVQSRYGGDTESTEGMDIMQRMVSMSLTYIIRESDAIMCTSQYYPIVVANI